MIDNRKRFLCVLVALCSFTPTFHVDHAWGEETLGDQLPFNPTPVAGDRYGCRIDISLDTIIVGGRGGTSAEGSAQIFYRDPISQTSTWVHRKTLASPYPTNGDKFGVGVGIDQNMAVVGASNNNTVYVYSLKGEAWNPDEFPSFSMPSVDNFGIDVRVSDEQIIVGSTDNKAYVYRKEEGEWAGTALTASHATSQFGCSVDISGTDAIVGDWGENTAYLYSLSGGNWVETADFSIPSGSFGESVSIYGDYAIVGAKATNYDTGLAIIYHRDNQGNWNEDAVLTAGDGMSGDEFGCSVDIGENYAVVGSLGSAGAGWTFGGATYLFQNDGSSWTEVKKLVPDSDEGYIEFGAAVALDEGDVDGEIANIVVGAWQSESQAGTAYTHQVAILGMRIPGDANLDGKVDNADALLLASNWLKRNGAIWGDGDFDNDGDVDDVDATVLAANWQVEVISPDPTASVPEPQSLLLLAIGVICLGLARRTYLGSIKKLVSYVLGISCKRSQYVYFSEFLREARDGI